MSELRTVPIGSIRPNPFRQLGKYPYVERKLEALQRSIKDVGLWEGVIAREQCDGFELAFGHHRIEAARRNELSEVRLIVRDLSDEDMLKFMGRENGEDYNTDFIVLLETWEAAHEFLVGGPPPVSTQAIDIAAFLGWISERNEASGRSGLIMTDSARACHSAHALIQGGYLSRDDLRGTKGNPLSVYAAREILGRAQSRMEMLNRQIAKASRDEQTRYTREGVEGAKKQVAKAAKKTIEDYSKGNVKLKDLGAEVDVNAYIFAKQAKKQTPLFEAFGKALANTIERMLKEDSSAERLNQMIGAVPNIQLSEDKEVIERISFELKHLSKRAYGFVDRIEKAGAENKVVRLNFAKE